VDGHKQQLAYLGALFLALVPWVQVGDDQCHLVCGRHTLGITPLAFAVLVPLLRLLCRCTAASQPQTASITCSSCFGCTELSPCGTGVESSTVDEDVRCSTPLHACLPKSGRNPMGVCRVCRVCHQVSKAVAQQAPLSAYHVAMAALCGIAVHLCFLALNTTACRWVPRVPGVTAADVMNRQ
jgi:hypothetical protein